MKNKTEELFESLKKMMGESIYTHDYYAQKSENEKNEIFQKLKEKIGKNADEYIYLCDHIGENIKAKNLFINLIEKYIRKINAVVIKDDTPPPQTQIANRNYQQQPTPKTQIAYRNYPK